ncbi:myzus persicae-induced lipase 1 isoform X2 [Wolffia australiana]
MTNNHLSLSIVAFILLLFFFLFSWSAIAETGVCSSLAVPSGYKCEEFDVKTEDGYILKMQRIPSVADQPGTPVLLQHGVLADGMVWQLNSPGEALAFVLADAGYDVWIANTRGTRWSRRHEILDPSSRAFWAWSWDELVTYDLPATVEFVYKQTGQKLHFVGHSQGTLIALAALSEGGLGEKLISAVMLSPIGFLTHMKTKLGVLAAKSFLGEIYAWLGIAEFDPAGSSVKNLMKKLCRNPTVNCYDLFSAFTGKNCCLNESTIELYLQYEPQSTSTRNMVHLAQSDRGNRSKRSTYQFGRIDRRRRSTTIRSDPIGSAR